MSKTLWLEYAAFQRMSIDALFEKCSFEESELIACHSSVLKPSIPVDLYEKANEWLERSVPLLFFLVHYRFVHRHF